MEVNQKFLEQAVDALRNDDKFKQQIVTIVEAHMDGTKTILEDFKLPSWMIIMLITSLIFWGISTGYTNLTDNINAVERSKHAKQLAETIDWELEKLRNDFTLLNRVLVKNQITGYEDIEHLDYFEKQYLDYMQKAALNEARGRQLALVIGEYNITHLNEKYHLGLTWDNLKKVSEKDYVPYLTWRKKENDAEEN